MSRASPPFGDLRPRPVRIPGAVPEEGNIGQIARTVFDAFGTARAGAQAATRQTIREQRVESDEDQVAIAQQSAFENEALRAQTRVLLENKELEREFDEHSDLELFGVQELFARGDEQTKADFLAKHRWADPKNQARIESFFGRQLATTDWFRAQQRIQEFYTNEANEGKSLSVTDLMGEFLQERSDLPAGASLAYQQQFMGQVGNFIFQQEASRALQRSKEVRKQRNRSNVAQAGLYFMGNAELEDFAQVVTDGIELVEGGEALDLVTDHMAQSAGQALGKLIGVVPNTELEKRIADLPTAVLNSPEIKFARAEMELAERQAQQKAITQEASNIKALSSQFKEANDIRSMVMLRGRAAQVPGEQGKQVRALLESRITQMDETRNFQISVMEQGANVTINDITSIKSDMSFERANFQRLSRTLREVGEVDQNKAFQLVADLPNAAIGAMLIRAKPHEVNGLVATLNHPQTRDLLADAIEKKNSFLDKSTILSSLAEAVPTDDAIDRYGDRFIKHMLDIQTREVDAVEDEGKAAKLAATMVKADLETDFVKLKIPLGVSTYGRADLFGVGNMQKGSKDGSRRLMGGLLSLSLEARRQGGISPNVGLAFEHKGKTYVPATGNGRAGAFLEWDPRAQEPKLLRPDAKMFGELQERLFETAEETDLVFNSDVRWRPSYGTRFVQEFDQAYFPGQTTGNISGWIANESQRRWFEQMGQLPRLSTEGLEGRELEEVQNERDLFRSFMNVIALELGWSGLDRGRVPPGFEQRPEFLAGANVPMLRAQQQAEKTTLDTFQQSTAAVTP